MTRWARVRVAGLERFAGFHRWVAIISGLLDAVGCCSFWVGVRFCEEEKEERCRWGSIWRILCCYYLLGFEELKGWAGSAEWKTKGSDGSVGIIGG
ncbi:hypothetical protein KY285_009031 [Solanum tuberosum]|nr:hypothetical protein KY285_009031 [Solanum tuberosum]